MYVEKKTFSKILFYIICIFYDLRFHWLFPFITTVTAQPNDKNGGSVDDLPLRAIICNVGTSSYQLAKYLEKLLSPLRRSQYTVSITKEYFNMIKIETIPIAYKMISFDVFSLFLWSC